MSLIYPCSSNAAPGSIALLLLAGLIPGQILAQNTPAPVPPASANRNSLEGQNVSNIVFEPVDQPLGRDELLRLLPVKIGAPLKHSQVREALQSLYLTGRYADVAIDADHEPLPGASVIVRVKTLPNFFVGAVTIEGVAAPPNRSQLLNASKLELGTPFVPAAMGQNVANMQERLRANGFYRSNLTYDLTPQPATEEMAVHFDLTAGPRARFDGANFTGQFKKPPDMILRATRFRRGFGPIMFPGWHPVTELRVQNGVERVRNLFLKDNRLQVRVNLSKLDYHSDSNTVTPSIEINQGPEIEVKTSGAKVSPSKLRELIPIFQESSVDQGLLAEGQRNLVDYFQAQGYFEATVGFTQVDETPEHEIITYTIATNDRHKLTSILFSGNKFFDTGTLRERLSIRKNTFLRFRWGRYSPKLRDQDRDLIRNLYRSNGFRDAQVNVKTLDDYKSRKDELAVSFDIVEGNQWLVNQLTIEGPSDQDAKYLRTILQSSEGQAFSDSNLSADRDSILSFYFNGGYPNATFDWTQTPAQQRDRIDLHYVIHPGDREFIRNVLVRGLDTTRDSLVDSRVQLKPGDPVSQGQIGASQQRLYDLGIFARVQTALQNPDGKEEDKNVLFQIDEAARYSFNLGIGAELARIGGGVTTLDDPAGETTFSPRVSAGISRLNLWGLGHTINLQTRVSTIQQRAILSYTLPQFIGHPSLALTFSGLFDDSRDVRTFAAQRSEASIQLAKKLSRANSFQARVSFRHVIVSSINIEPELIPLLSQPVRVGIASMAYIQDRRDNAVDSHRGIYNTIDAGVSLPQFGSTSSFTRLLMRNSTYHPIGKDIVLARTLQFGYQQRLSGLIEIPLAERFFSGGDTSNRAFPDNQAGPRDIETGFPIGGSALLFHSTELRFPLIGDNIGGVLFHDMGNVYSDVRDISFRFHQNGNQDFNYMVQSVGFGIRYRTPIGPVRIDLSYSPNSPRFFGFEGTREQLLENQGTLTNQRINVFQFHFSLGQTF